MTEITSENKFAEKLLCGARGESIENCRSACITSLEDDIVKQQERYDLLSEDGDADDTGDQELLSLGFVVETEDQSCLRCPLFLSKAGGTPAWLEPIHLPSGRSFVCDFCEEPLRFVLQVDSPISSKQSAYHRTIFVFMCPSRNCLRRDQHEQQKHGKEDVLRSVKVFRCQLPLVNPFYASDGENSQGSAKHLGPKAALCSWCDTWKADKLCSGCRRVRFCSRKHQIMHWRSGHKADCKEMASQLSNSYILGGDSASAKIQRAPNSTQWPEYEITFRKRCKSSAELSDANALSSLASIEGKDDGLKAMFDYFEGDDEKKSLAYFNEQIAEDQGQVLRCWTSDGKPLWPMLRGRPSTTDIPKCSYCGGPMCFEFQILSQLLYFFRETDDDSPDWATIAIYTCEASCDSDAVYKEEFPWVQLYS